MKTTNTSLLDYSKINVIDMCYFLNDKVDLTSNEYLKKFSSLLFSKVEMYEYFKFKTDNFDKYKFQLVFDEICDFCFSYMDFYKLEKVDGKIRNKHVSDFDFDYSIEFCKPLEYINSTLELNKGLIVNSNSIIDFVEIAENLYQEHCKETTKKPALNIKHNQLQTKLTDTQRGKLFDLLLSNKYIAPNTNKESFIWAFGGEQTQPADWQPIDWIDKSVTRKEPNIQTLYELLYLLGVDKDTSANKRPNLYDKMKLCFNGLVNIAAKNPTSIQQKTYRQIHLKTIIDEVENLEA